MFFSSKPQISVCIPVYSTESCLEACLESVAAQIIPSGIKNSSFAEIIVIDDGSPVPSDGKTCSQIVKDFKRKSPFKITLISHAENKGLLEARRSGVFAARGKYILNLDSDDQLEKNCLFLLYNSAVSTDAHIVHAKGCIRSSSDADHILEKKRKVENVMEGFLEGKEIFRNCFLEQAHSGFIWGKLIDRELYLKAFAHIPVVECTMGEDILQYFWISKLAKKYHGINETVYFYSVEEGISSHVEIDDLERWKKVCSASSVFTSIFLELNDLEEDFCTEQELDAIKGLCVNYLLNNLRQLDVAVVDSLKKEAYEILCDYWGKEFVENVQKKAGNHGN